MHLITILFAKTGRALSVSIAALVISAATISSVAAADIPTIYNDACAACHDSGALGALKKGDARWQQLIQQKGMPALVQSVKGGMIQMPAGGLCDNCSDEDYRKLINYMSQ
ncbi:cytochrome c5 [Psychrobacter sp. PL15]|jgi:cytochrome c5|uniref:c-type cytochrome n=1 Tax=unclassified Psychrobacter TaxID=196806 RepID=UPI001AE44A47|nr:c-type cytochrome [Psychrobacter sp. PL15]MEC5210004.1 cytochrome c5 [Psychrobacter sp. PL15]